MTNQNTEWRQKAHEVIKQIALNNQYIVSDMVVTELEKANLGLNNYSSLGGVFTRAAKDGIIKKTDDKQQSTRSKSHSAKTVWVSLIYKDNKSLTGQEMLNSILMAALDFNAQTVRYASLIFSKGELTKSGYAKAINDYLQIQKGYTDRLEQITKAYVEWSAKK